MHKQKKPYCLKGLCFACWTAIQSFSMVLNYTSLLHCLNCNSCDFFSKTPIDGQIYCSTWVNQILDLLICLNIYVKIFNSNVGTLNIEDMHYNDVLQNKQLGMPTWLEIFIVLSIYI